MSPGIRKYDPDTDRQGLRQCVVELQEFERRLDPRMPPGEEIADQYIEDMADQCARRAGKILISSVDGDIAGYIMILCKVSSGDLDDGDIEFGLISDLMVRETYRGQRLGEKLVRAAEAIARENGVTWLRINVLASNHIARGLYQRLGYADYTLDLEKTLI